MDKVLFACRYKTRSSGGPEGVPPLNPAPLLFFCPLVTLMFLNLAACCLPQDLSVAVARGNGHVTFAQRPAVSGRNGYLVDCRVAADGAVTDCYTVELKGE